MKENDLRSLIKKSEIETSEDFTDSLMERLKQESQPAIQQQIGLSFKMLLIFCGALVLLICFLAFQLAGRAVIETDLAPGISKLPLIVLGLGTMLYTVNNLIRTMELSSKP